MQPTQITSTASGWWQNIAPVYKAILDLPFNLELSAGTLSIDTFRFYVYQDSLYLADFARALAVTAARSTNSPRVLEFLRFAENAIVVERALHESYFEEFGVPDDLEQSPACAFYTNYLLATASLRSYEEAVAALLPCFWIYREVGNSIHEVAAQDNRYRQWIDTYAGADFNEAVDRAITISDDVAATTTDSGRARMQQAFVTSSRLEWLFWDSAYRMEMWSPQFET